MRPLATCLLLPLLVLGTQPRARAEGPEDVAGVLAPILEKHGVPGMVGAIVVGEDVKALGAVGVRRRGSPDKVTVTDRFHLGSCTKAMTATLAALLVEDKRLRWSTTVGSAFPDLRERMDPAWRGVPLEWLLQNRGGAPASLDEGGLWGRLFVHPGTPVEQRRALVEGVTTRAPAEVPGTKFLYSNANFAIAGGMAETIQKEAWEDLMRKRLFEPLGITSSGFGAPGTAGVLDEPRGHGVDGTPVEPGRGSDNPPAIGPAGTIHMTITDWAKFVALHLRGAQGKGRLLSKASFARLHTPPSGQEYAMGWVVGERPWAGGRVLRHSGSNTMWYCVTWLAPAKDFAILVCCNQGGDGPAKACDDASSALILHHLAAR